MSRIPTLRGRLALLAALTTAVWVGLLTVGFNALLASQLHSQSTSLLRQRAAAAAATVTVGSDGAVRIADPANDEALDTNVWIYQGRRALERPRAGTRIQQVADQLAGTGEHFRQTAAPRATRLFALPISGAGGQVATVVVAVTLDPYDHVARLALLASTGLAVLLLVGVYAASRLVISRALVPVQQMSVQAARWSALDASQRFGRAGRPAELAVLAENLDGVLDRVAGLLRHEQQITEELSHELRTPLSLIVAEVDLLRSRPRSTAEADAALMRIGDGAGHMKQILETLLHAARTRSTGSTGRCSLRDTVDVAISRLPSGGPHVDVSGDRELAAEVDAEVVERILAPLLDNARRYADERISLRLEHRGADAVVRLWDDGPGVDPALGAAAFEPGRRDPHSSPDGAGLGLALARRLARAAGGELELAEGAFELRLPAGP